VGPQRSTVVINRRTAASPRSPGRRRTRWHFYWLLATASAVVFFVLAALDQPVGGALVPPFGWLVRVALLLAGCVAVVTAFAATRALSSARGRGPEVSQVLPHRLQARYLGSFPSLDALQSDRRHVTDTYAKRAIVLFGRMLTDPAYRLRLEETITLDSDKARTQSKAEYSIPWPERRGLAEECRDAARPEVVLVPLLWPLKGTLLDDLVITDSGGVRLVALSRAETSALVGWACVPLFSAAVSGDPGSRFDASRWAVMNRIRQLIAYPDPVDPDELWERIEATMRDHDLDPGALAEAHPGAYANFRKTCRSLAQRYVLAVEVPVPAGALLSIQYTRSVTVRSFGPGGLRGGIEDMIGLEPSRFEIAIVAAELYASYHAEIDGRAQDRYVRFQEVVNNDAEGSPPVDDSVFQLNPARPDHPPRMMLRNDSGYIYPHLHLTNLGYLEAPPRLSWRVHFEEIPPGGLGPVVAMSTAVTLITMVFALAAARITALDLNAPALALAVPLFVITVFGFSFTRLIRSTLTVVGGFVAASVLAVLAVVTLLTLRDVGPGELQPFVLSGWTVLGLRFHLLLALCALAGLMLTSYLTAALIIWTRRYRVHQQRVHDIIGGDHDGAGTPHRR
jgi:hypothetical protein